MCTDNISGDIYSEHSIISVRTLGMKLTALSCCWLWPPAGFLTWLSDICVGQGIVQQRQTWGQKAPGFSWVTFGRATYSIGTFVAFVLLWTSLSSLSYNQASVPGPNHGSMSSKAHRLTLHCEAMTSIDQEDSSLGSGPTFHFPTPSNPHYNLTFKSSDLVSSPVFWKENLIW